MYDEPPDPFLAQLCEGYTDAEVVEIQQYMAEWDASTYISVAQSILDNANNESLYSQAGLFALADN